MSAAGSAVVRSPKPSSPSSREPSPEPQADSPGVPSRLRAIRFWTVLALLVVAVAVVTIVTRPTEDRTALSPQNPAPEGAQAVAEVLADQGVEVRYATTLEEASEQLARAGESSTLFFSDPSQWLDTAQLNTLQQQVTGNLVLAAPTFTQLQALAPGVHQAGQLAADGGPALEAECSFPPATAAGNITAGGKAYRADTVCFPAGGEQQGAGSVAVENSGNLVVLGNPGMISNKLITENGNAALTLHLLGSQRVLVWYQPTVDDLQADAQPQNPAALLPPWVGFLTIWLLIVAAFAALWRGRRMGPLVVEPLPVVVRASETADGRARLYQDSRAVVHAAENLRSASLVRIARQLGLGRSAGIHGVIAATARATSRTPQEVAAVLDGAAPTSEAEMVRWAQALTALEKEVRQA